jgi:hypothetical protein
MDRQEDGLPAVPPDSPASIGRELRDAEQRRERLDRAGTVGDRELSGAGGAWDVVEAHFMNYQWWNWSSPRTTTAAVNSSGNQHLHMFCGGKRNG